MKKFAVIFLIAVTGIVAISNTTSQYFEIAKNFEIFGSLFKELNTYYVDEIDPNELIQEGINAMLSSLDPYTNFYSEADIETFRFETTGKYGGIGSLIKQGKDYIVITEPYEGFPADKAGLIAGDKILEVDGKNVKGKNSEEVSRFLKGEPGTSIVVKVLRPQADGSDKEMSLTVKREEIKVKNIPYYGMVQNDYGYINLANFTQFAGKEVEDAFKDLKSSNPNMKGVILDVRGNPGGLLNEAVNIVNVFVDKGQKVVFTKGKVSEWDKDFKTLNEPYDTKMPIVVLTNRGSASASEIVSGAIQDFDRGVVVGQKTFGKGLVQTTRKLTYNTQLKVTTAKYYIPSGRCIQAINYAEKDEEGAVVKIPDSLKVAFKTNNGRIVYDGGGVDPDIIIEQDKLSDISIALLRNDLFFDYATYFKTKNNELNGGVNFRMSEIQFRDFTNWLNGKDYEYTTRSEKLLEEFKESSKTDGYFDAVEASYLTMKKDIHRDKENDIEKNKGEIIRMLENEIVRRFHYRKGAIENSFYYDNEVNKAVEILGSQSEYKKLLGFKN